MRRLKALGLSTQSRGGSDSLNGGTEKCHSSHLLLTLQSIGIYSFFKCPYVSKIIIWIIRWMFLAVVYIIYKDHILKAVRPLQYLHFMSTWKFALDEWVFLNTCHIYICTLKLSNDLFPKKQFNFSFRHNENIITDDKPLPGMIELKPCP